MRRLLLLLLAALNAHAAGHELAPRPLGVTPYNANGPQTTWSDGRFVTTWSESMGAIGDASRAVISDANGRRVSEPFVTTAPATQIGNGTRFLRAEHIWDVYPSRSEATLLDVHGRVVQGGIALDPRAWTFDVKPFTGGFVVLSSSSNGLIAHRIANDGTLVTRTIDTGVPSFTSTIDESGRVFVVWSSASVVKSAIVTMDLDVIEMRTLAISGPPVAQPLHLMHTGGGFYVLLYDTPHNSRFQLASITIAPDGTTRRATTYPAAGTPLAASAASNGRTMFVSYMTEWSFLIYGMAIDIGGTASTPELLSLGRERHTPPVLTSTGAGALAAWSAFDGRTPSFAATAIAPNGEVSASRERVSSTLLGTRDLAWNGEQALTLVVDGTSFSAVRIDAQGRILGKSALFAEPVITPYYRSLTTVVWAGDRWMVLLPWSSRIRFMTVTTSGVVSAPRDLPNSTTPPYNLIGGIRSLAASWDGTNIVLAWSEHYSRCDPRCSAFRDYTRIARITREGETLDATPLEIFPAATLSLASSGAGEAVLVADTTAYAIDTRGTAPRITASTRVLNWSGQGDVTWDGVDYVVALRYVGARWHTSLSRFDRALQATAPMRTIVTRAPDDITPPSVAATAPRAAIVAVPEGDAENGVGAVVYKEEELSVAPAPPRPPRQVYSRSVSSSTREITWAVADDAELYRVEGWYGDEWTGWEHVATLTPDQLPRVVSRYPFHRVIAFNAGGASEPVEAGTPPSARRRSSRP